MPQQGDLFSPRDGSSSSVQAASLARSRSRRGAGWLRTVELVLFVVLRIYVGIIVLLLPWTPLWRENQLLHYWSVTSAIFNNGAVRGVISGLGVLNLWIAITELFRRMGSRT